MAERTEQKHDPAPEQAQEHDNRSEAEQPVRAPESTHARHCAQLVPVPVRVVSAGVSIKTAVDAPNPDRQLSVLRQQAV